jgi:predicted Zn-dependent protease
LSDAKLAAILGGPPGADTTEAGAEALRLILAGYGRDAETSADGASLLYLSRAGIDPRGMIEVMEKMNPVTAEKKEFWEQLTSGNAHPQERIASLREDVRSMGLDAGLARDQRPYAPIKRLLN